MLLTISNSKPISTGRFVANCLLAGISYGCGELLKRCWSINTCSHFNFITHKISWSLNGLQTVLPQLWWRRSWSWKVWACQHQEVHNTWRRYYSKMTLRHSYGWWSRSYFQKSSITLKVSSRVYHLMYKDLNNEESKGYELQRCHQRLECYDSILIFWGDLP